MEAFESFVAVALASEGFVVSPAVKFRVRLKTKKLAYAAYQEHGYEVDLVGASADRLVLATVKSYFGSRGVVADHVTDPAPTGSGAKRYALLNNEAVRRKVVALAAERYGYKEGQVELRFYVGHFAGKGAHRERIEDWAAAQSVGAGPIKVVGLDEVVRAVRTDAESTQYQDNPVLVTIKVLEAAGQLVPIVENAPAPPPTLP